METDYKNSVDKRLLMNLRNCGLKQEIRILCLEIVFLCRGRESLVYITAEAWC